MAQPICLALIVGCSLATLVGLARAQQPDRQLNPQPDQQPGQQQPGSHPHYAMVPASPSDIFVQGKFDQTGTYVPAHYEPKPKPQFHGYFDKDTTVRHGYFDTPKPAKPVVPPD